MKKVIVEFDNLWQPHSSGIIGMTQPVKALVAMENLSKLEEIGERARKAAGEFGKMFPRKRR